MNHKYIKPLINCFYKNRFSKEAQHAFQKWFVDAMDSSIKDEALLDIFEAEATASDRKTWDDLRKVKKRIKAFESAYKTPLYVKLSQIAAVILIIVLSAVSVYLYQTGNSIYSNPELVECFVPYGEQKTIELPDGSIVWINAGSLIVYAKGLEGKNRTVYLNGEATFHVTKDSEKPFIVKTNDMYIKALGTVFHVESYAESKKSITTLKSGKVQIETKQTGVQQSIILLPNEELVYNRLTKELVHKPVDLIKSDQKRLGYLIFEKSSFEEMVKAIERRYNVVIVYDRQTFGGRTFNVKFLPHEDVKQVFEVLKDIGNFNYQMKDNTIYIEY